MHLDSPDDPRLADYRSVSDPTLAVRHGLFIAEGRLVVRRLLEHATLRTRSVLVTATAHAALDDALQRRPDVPVYVVPPEVLAGVAGFHIHRGCLALGERAVLPAWQTLAATAQRLVLLEQIGDPDNVGAIVRSAAAFGMQGVLLAPGCADPLYRKAIRTSMGTALNMPFALAEPWPQLLHELQEQAWTVVALTPVRQAPPLAEILHGAGARVAVLVGHEGNGLSDDALRLCPHRARIPMAQSVDSLNVAAAAAIAFYEASGRHPGSGSGDGSKDN